MCIFRWEKNGDTMLIIYTFYRLIWEVKSFVECPLKSLVWLLVMIILVWELSKHLPSSLVASAEDVFGYVFSVTFP